MRKLGLALLACSLALVPYAAMSQEDVAPTPDDFVCALTGECPDEAEEGDETAPPGDPRISATRGFSLSRTTPPRQKATTTNRQRSGAQQQRTQRRTTAAAQQQPEQGRVDLRLSFATGSSLLSDAAQARLQAFAEALKRPQLASVRVRIEGHTDSSGGRTINVALSQRRAQAVADYLVSQGIAADRLEVQGYGYDRPLPGRRASDGANRRVEAVRIS